MPTKEMQLNEADAAKALFRSMGGCALILCLMALAVISVQMGLLRPAVLQDSSRMAGGLCAEVDKIKGQVPPTPKLAITPIPQNSALVGRYPDLDYIPLYPGPDEEDVRRNAEVEKANHTNIGRRYFEYFAPANTSLEDVVAFYRGALTQNGWHPVGDPLPAPIGDKKTFVQQLCCTGTHYYVWTDPEERTPWHFYVEVDIAGVDGAMDMEGRVGVNLSYGRYPDTVKNLPLYPGAMDIEMTCSEEPGDALDHGLPVTTINKTYLTSATPEQLADYYNTTLPPFAWSFFDKEMMDRLMWGQIDDPGLVSARQAGDINSEEGLIFQGMASYNAREFALAPSLNITASRTEDGRTKVQLRVRVEQHGPLPAIDAPAK